MSLKDEFGLQSVEEKSPIYVSGCCVKWFGCYFKVNGWEEDSEWALGK